MKERTEEIDHSCHLLFIVVKDIFERNYYI